MLAVLISEKAMSGNELLEEGIVRPMLAIIGGFSADLLYTLINRMVESLKSLFEGSTKDFVDAKEEQLQAQLGTQVAQTKIRLQQQLVEMQNQMSGDISPAMQTKFNEMISGVGSQD
ncbi:MAG: hypothetical protein CMJ78_02185 [Planctomycetaceae bacterium]|nr:hypothetical protein [Planctomycetaceae bacterium]